MRSANGKKYFQARLNNLPLCNTARESAALPVTFTGCLRRYVVNGRIWLNQFTKWLHKYACKCVGTNSALPLANTLVSFNP